MKKNLKSGILVILCIMSLFIIVNGTVAWLTGKSGLLKNQFSYGNIKITLHDDSNTGDGDTINYEITPGTKIEKKTYIKVKEKSEDCWLFVKINETDNFKDFMTYSLEDNWTKLENNENVYYMKVNKSNDEQVFNVFKNNEILVRTDVTKEQFSSLTLGNYPSLSVSASAVQRNDKIDEIDTALEAWQLINN